MKIKLIAIFALILLSTMVVMANNMCCPSSKSKPHVEIVNVEITEFSDEDFNGCSSTTYVYKSYDDYELELVVDLPNNREQETPFIIYVHGGGWKNGGTRHLGDYSKYMASRGIAGVRISYSVISQNSNFDQGMAELETALEFVKEHAEEWNLDLDRMGFAGASAGTPLASLMAMKSGADLYLGYNGVYNLVRTDDDASFPRIDSPYLTGYDAEKLADLSAINHIPYTNVPVVALFHGNKDVVISYRQSVMFAEAIGETAFAYIYPGYGHSFFNKKASDAYSDVVIKSYNVAEIAFGM